MLIEGYFLLSLAIIRMLAPVLSVTLCIGTRFFMYNNKLDMVLTSKIFVELFDWLLPSFIWYSGNFDRYSFVVFGE